MEALFSVFRKLSGDWHSEQAFRNDVSTMQYEYSLYDIRREIMLGTDVMANQDSFNTV